MSKKSKQKDSRLDGNYSETPETIQRVAEDTTTMRLATMLHQQKMARIKKEPTLSESFRESFENPTFILSSIVVFVCSFRFLFDGVTFGLGGFSATVGSTDPLAYGSILMPVIAGHAYIRAKARHTQKKLNPKADNPDA